MANSREVQASQKRSQKKSDFAWKDENMKDVSWGKLW